MRTTALLPLLFLGCSTPIATTDMGAGDLAVPADLTLVPPDMSSVALGNRIVSGKNMVGLEGVTTDDHVVYLDKTGAVSAVPLAGGTPQAIAGNVDRVFVAGKAVFAWNGVDMATGAGDLTVWTAAAGVKMLGTSSPAGLAAASDDGGSILYTIDASMDGSTADLWIAKPDGTGALKLLSGILTGVPCGPRMGWYGNKFFVTHCDPTDGGASSPTVSAVDTAGNVTTVKANASNFFSANKTGSHLLVASDMGDGAIVTADGMTSTPIDTKVGFGYLLPDASGAVYRTTDMTIRRATIPNPMPQTLVTMNVTGLESFSDDGKAILFYSKGDPNINSYSDLYLASTTTPGMPTTLTSKTSGAIFGDAFTADSSRVLYFTDCTGQYVGTFYSIPAAGGTPVKHGTSAWLVYATSGTRVVYNDHFKPVSNSSGRADLLALDVAKTDAPSLVASQAEVDIFLNTAKDKVVYISLSAAGVEGLYVAPVPQ